MLLGSIHGQGSWWGGQGRGVVLMSREVVDAISVAAAGARLRGCGEQVPRPVAAATGMPGQGPLSVAAEAARFDAVWGDALAAVRAELGLLASALQRASWARQSVERMNAQLLSHAEPAAAVSLA